jgi:diguanylate cyclase (GGDEF)-like protein/PAS domain S-box-containing protein
METTADSIYFKDRECRLIRVSRKMALDLGFDGPADLIGKTDNELFGEVFGLETRRDDLRVMEMDRPFIGMIESRQLTRGRMNWTLTTKLPLHDEAGRVIGLVGITREINEIRQVEATLQHLATHDGLTELPNRYLMIDRMSQLLARARRSGTSFAVLFMDIDGFKGVNDAHGHDLGDLLLQAVAKRLAGSVRQSDTVARIGGDEFVIIQDPMGGIGDAETLAEHVETALARAFILQKHRVKVTASIGLSFYPQNGEDPESLLKAADYAMYLAKREGGNRHLACAPGMPESGSVRERH